MQRNMALPPAIQEAFPGFDPFTPSASAMTDAARVTLEELAASGHLTKAHALTCRLIMDLAQALDRGLSQGRVTVATSNLVKQLLDAIASLPGEAAAPAVDPLTAEIQALTRQLANQAGEAPAPTTGRP